MFREIAEIMWDKPERILRVILKRIYFNEKLGYVGNLRLHETRELKVKWEWSAADFYDKVL